MPADIRLHVLGLSFTVNKALKKSNAVEFGGKMGTVSQLKNS